ncbi:MAG TPA: glycoside hydrolase family 18 protein [Terracidiphilus sp.]|nr:glycoside hydrolase family 18 protein [Terracidiphilus sp.]
MTRIRVAKLACLIFLLPTLGVASNLQDHPAIVVAYVFPQKGVLQPDQVDPHGVDRINYAFANIVDGRMVEGFQNDAANFEELNALKRENPSLEVLVSVGGWTWSNHFSDVSLTAQSRKVFIQSVMDFIAKYDLDGLDVDWEYPGQAGAGNVFRSQDKKNYTLLLKELRQSFDRRSRTTHKHLFLTIAAGTDNEFLTHTQMGKVQRYVDAVNLMCYDYYEPGSDAITGNHAPLYANPADPKRASSDASVRAFEAAGVPTSKIILGVPFYGHMWGQVANVSHGLFQPGKPVPNGYAPYTAISGSMLNHGFIRYWDAAANVPYLYNETGKIFVSYEDPESLAIKCNYVLKNKLGGVMFWSYLNDTSGALLGAIDRGLRGPSNTHAGSQ